MDKKVFMCLSIYMALCLMIGAAFAQQPIQRTPFKETPIVKPQPAATEECHSFNLASTSVTNKGGNWVIVDSTKPNVIIASFPGNQKADADRTLDIIKKYGMNQVCFVKPGVAFQYELAGGQAPTGTYSGEVCKDFNPETLSMSNIQGRWKIIEGTNEVFDFASNQAQAMLVLNIIKKHGFTRSCSVGKPALGFHYMAKQADVPKPAVMAPSPKVVQEIKPPMKPMDLKPYSSTTGITITSPAKNSTWYTNSNLSIQWKATPSSGMFHIFLKTPAMDDNTALMEITSYRKMESDQQGMFSHTWQIPSGTKMGDYVVQVMDANQPGVFARSEVFKIILKIPPKATLSSKVPNLVSPQAIGSITVTSPVKNSTYTRGVNTLSITWKTVGRINNQVKIVLYSEGQSRLADVGQAIDIVKSTSNDGRFDWPIPENFRTGKFQVRVQTIDNRIKGDSEGFSIQQSGQASQTTTATAPITPTPGPFSIKVTSPSGGEQWNVGGTYTVKWKPTGLMSGSARIIAYYPGTESDCAKDYSKYKTWEELGRTDIYAGYYSTTIGVSKLFRGPAKIRVMIESGLTFGDSGEIKIGDPKITVNSPSKDETWVPLKPYTVKWDISGLIAWVPNVGDMGHHVNIRLVPIGQPTPSNQVLLAKEVHTEVRTPGTGEDKYSGTYTGILGNVPSGNYRVRVERTINPLFYAESLPIIVKSSMDPTIVIGPSGDEVDLALTEVFFDGIDTGYLTAKIKNLWGDFKGSLKFDYEFEKFIHESDNVYGVTENKITGTVDKPVEFKAQETKTVPFLYWNNFNYITYPPHYQNYFIPLSGPWKGKVTITPSKKDSDPTNNKIEGVKLCKAPKADIGTMGFIRLTFTSQSLTLFHGTEGAIKGNDMKWISNDTFEAQLEVVLWNYGCMERNFLCNLYVDDLPGLWVISASLKPGEKITSKGKVNIDVPFKYGPHRLVFVADESESQNQGYPNSYKNNVVSTQLWIVPY